MKNENFFKQKYPLMRIFLFCGLFFLSVNGDAAEVRVAVASNFQPALERLAGDFEKDDEHRLLISSGSSGKLFAQIKQGAPYDVFLSADELRPNRLVQEGVAVRDSAYVYALGKLVLLSRLKPDECGDVLRSRKLRRLAIANPRTAPYGRAAKEVLQELGLWQALQAKRVTGENVMQAFQYVATGNAQAGFIAASLLSNGAPAGTACIWTVPENLYSPVKQKAVLLKRATGNRAARRFMHYLQSDRAKAIIRVYGYDVTHAN